MATKPAALVNEAYFACASCSAWTGRTAITSSRWWPAELRRILIDQARLRMAQKREGSQRRVPMSEDLSWIDVRGQDMLDLDRALDELEQVDGGQSPAGGTAVPDGLHGA